MTALLLALLLGGVAPLDYFNAEVARLRPSTIRIFLGAQPGPVDESSAYAWTKCIPESGVFVTQASERLLSMDAPKIQRAAAHEVAHIVLHGHAICSGSQASALPARVWEMNIEADRCATVLLAGGACR